MEEGNKSILYESQLKREDRTQERAQADFQHFKQVLAQTEEELRVAHKQLDDKEKENGQLKVELTEILKDFAKAE